MPTTLRTVALTGATTVALLGLAIPATAEVSTGQSTGPTITSYRPSHAPVGATLRILGRGLTGTDSVTVHGQPASIVGTPTDSEVDVTVPQTTSGRVVATQAPTVSNPAGTSATGPVFDIQKATTAAIQLSHTALGYPEKLTVTGSYKLASTGRPLGHEVAALQAKHPGTPGWHRVHTTSPSATNSHGKVTWTITPSQDEKLRVHVSPNDTRLAATSAARSIGVRPLVALSVPGTTQTRQGARLTGTVRPRLSGRVAIQRREHGAWHTIAHRSPSHGDFSLTVSPQAAGRYTYRAVRGADSLHQASVSHRATTTVIARTLSIGDSGSDVASLQRQLRHLHYDVGPASKYYGDDLLHAVTAFEKIQGLTKDGSAGRSVQRKLSHPKVPHLRHPLKGDAVSVEVDLHRQVLLIAKHGKIWRILDTSTAGGYYYTDSEGQSEKAVTPTGHFSIKYKEEGTVHSSLGTLYRPSYFNYSGYAIHGEGDGNDGSEVPPYPNSHGCVRITNLAVDRYYNLLAVGVSVWIYS